MTVYLKIIASFFKAWFMPQPAHDQFGESHSEPDPETEITESDSPTLENATTDTDIAPPADNHITASGNPEPDPSEIPPDPINRNIANIDISHLVNPPEGSEGRASRGTEIDDPSITE